MQRMGEVVDVLRQVATWRRALLSCVCTWRTSLQLRSIGACKVLSVTTAVQRRRGVCVACIKCFCCLEYTAAHMYVLS